MNKDLASIRCIEQMLPHMYESHEPLLYEQPIVDHYTKLLQAIQNPTCEGLNILIFQPVATGDIIVSSLAAELLFKKYPGCSVDYMVEFDQVKPILEGNPFIRSVIVEKDWEKFRTRDTTNEKIDGKPSEDGPLIKDYDLAYSLYWWNAPMITSFLEDLRLPTDYTRLHIYKNDKSYEKVKDFWKDSIGLKIALQRDIDMKTKWDISKYPELYKKLEELGIVKVVGSGLGYNYSETAEILRRADMFVGVHGSIEHVAAAVECQTITMPNVYKPEDVCAAYYQNKYRDPKKPCLVVKPKDFCGNYRCISYNPNDLPNKEPRYGFNSEGKFPPHMVRSCDYKSFKNTCIHEISVNDVVSQVEKAIELRK